MPDKDQRARRRAQHAQEVEASEEGLRKSIAEKSATSKPAAEASGTCALNRAAEEGALAVLIGALPGMAYQCSVRAPWTLTYASQGVFSLSGYSSDEFTSGKMVWADIVHPDDLPAIADEVDAAVEERRPFSLTYRILCRSGEEKWVLERGEALYAPSGEAQSLVGFIAEITQQNRAEAKLRDAEQRYALAARASNAAVWDWNLVSGEVAWAGAITQALGYSEDAVGKDHVWWKDRIHTDDYDNVFGSIQAAIEGDSHFWSHEYRFRRADGSYVWVHDQGFIVRNSEGEAERMVGAMQDVTERKAAQSAVHRLQTELIQISRLSAMGTVASTLAHELNQPLSAAANWMTGSQRLLDRGPEFIPQASEGLSQARSSIEKAGEIIKRVRKMVASGEATTHKEDLRSVVDEAVMLTSELAQHAGVSCKVQVPKIYIEADRIQLQQVLLNLIRNGIEAMGASARKELKVSARKVQGCAEVSVADTGPGLAPDIRDQLFTPYLSTKEGGLGLGLSVCRTIVEAHQGKMWVDENPEGGTIFRFNVPVAGSTPR